MRSAKKKKKKKPITNRRQGYTPDRCDMQSGAESWENIRIACVHDRFTHLVGVQELAAAQELVDDEVVVRVILGQALVEVEGGVEAVGESFVDDGGSGGGLIDGGDVDLSGTHLDGCRCVC